MKDEEKMKDEVYLKMLLESDQGSEPTRLFTSASLILLGLILIGIAAYL